VLDSPASLVSTSVHRQAPSSVGRPIPAACRSTSSHYTGFPPAGPIPSAQWPSIVTTDESTPPESAATAVPSPTVAHAIWGVSSTPKESANRQGHPVPALGTRNAIGRQPGDSAIWQSGVPGYRVPSGCARLPSCQVISAFLLLWVEGAERYAVKLFQLLRHHGLVEFAAPGGAGRWRAARMTCGAQRPYGIGSLTWQAPEALSGLRRRRNLLDALI
jgi:hypothetical protein